jgi:hypothetical protein
VTRRAIALASLILTALTLALVACDAPPGPPGPPAPSGKAATTPAPARPKGAFVHPGVLVSREQLDFAKAQVRAGAQPWAPAFEQMSRSKYAALGWKPRPTATVECGPYNNPDVGCSAEADDAVAAYTQALLWWFTGDRRHAETAIRILDAYPPVIRRHTNVNAKLASGWAGATFSRAAELIRYSDAGWPAASAKRFGTMLRKVYLPVVIVGAPTTNGNWDLIMMDAATGIAVYNNDRASFNRAVALWRKRMAAYVYLRSDGDRPKTMRSEDALAYSYIVRYWHGQTKYVDGLTQETCRDLSHTAWALVAASHVAETGRIQGLDLYGEVRDRMVAALEFNIRYELGEKVPSWLCGGHIEKGFGPVPEVAYNEYAVRDGIPLPWTRKLIDRYRLGEDQAAFFYAWETLTHGSAQS